MMLVAMVNLVNRWIWTLQRTVAEELITSHNSAYLISQSVSSQQWRDSVLVSAWLNHSSSYSCHTHAAAVWWSTKFIQMDHSLLFRFNLRTSVQIWTQWNHSNSNILLHSCHNSFKFDEHNAADTAIFSFFYTPVTNLIITNLWQTMS